MSKVLAYVFCLWFWYVKDNLAISKRTSSACDTDMPRTTLICQRCATYVVWFVYINIRLPLMILVCQEHPWIAKDMQCTSSALYISVRLLVMIPLCQGHPWYAEDVHCTYFTFYSCVAYVSCLWYWYINNIPGIHKTLVCQGQPCHVKYAFSAYDTGMSRTSLVSQRCVNGIPVLSKIFNLILPLCINKGLMFSQQGALPTCISTFSHVLYL